MNTREQIEQALKDVDIQNPPLDFEVVLAEAARAYLPYAPTQCDKCDGTGCDGKKGERCAGCCPVCGGSGILPWQPTNTILERLFDAAHNASHQGDFTDCDKFWCQKYIPPMIRAVVAAFREDPTG